MEARARRMAFRSGALSEVRRAEADRHLKVICSWRRQGSVRRSRCPILIVKVECEMWMPSIVVCTVFLFLFLILFAALISGE